MDGLAVQTIFLGKGLDILSLLLKPGGLILALATGSLELIFLPSCLDESCVVSKEVDTFS